MPINYNSDSFFCIGSSHAGAGGSCQDYACHDDNPYYSAVTISDGCSSGERTDIGSRIVALSAMNSLGFVNSADFNTLQKDLIKSRSDSLGLKFNDLLATSITMIAYYRANCDILNTVKAYINGDGVIAMRYKDGSVSMRNYTWKNNMPYYPCYQLENNIPLFLAAQPDQDAFTIDFVGRDGAETSVKMCAVDAIPNRSNNNTGNDYTLHVKPETDLIAIFSDGITQISDIDWKDAVREFMAVKNTNGEFVKRRMLRGLKDMKAKGHIPYDDISAAMIHISES